MEKDAVAEEWMKSIEWPGGARKVKVLREQSRTVYAEDMVLREEVLGFFQDYHVQRIFSELGERWRWSEMDVRGSWKLRVQQHKQATLVVLVRRQKSVWQGCKEEGMER